jgi:pre-rRNA-processing protein TSR2
VNDDDDDEDDDVGGDDGNDNDDSSDVMLEDSSNMMVDAPESVSNLDMPVNDHRPKVAAETEDGWVQVSRRRNRGKRN